MMTFDGMAIEAIGLFQGRHPAPAIGMAETGHVDGHRFAVAEEAAEEGEVRRFRVKLSDGRAITYTARYAITHGGKKITGLGEIVG